MQVDLPDGRIKFAFIRIRHALLNSRHRSRTTEANEADLDLIHCNY